MNTESISVITFNPIYARSFREINLEWINEYFTIEPYDIEQLFNPEKNILDNGGEIFFVLVNGRVAGTCALIKTGAAEFKLAKMGIKSEYRGLKIGQIFLKEIIEYCKKIGCERLWLGTSSKLLPAIHLYKKFGFKEYQVSQTPMKRTDIHMEFILQPR